MNGEEPKVGYGHIEAWSAELGISSDVLTLGRNIRKKFNEGLC
jgi:hypothetical protein